jgi:hypothetical protein
MRWLQVALTAALVMAGRGEADVLRWVPTGTRLVFDLDPQRAASQPRAREALGVDLLLARFAVPRLDAGRLRRITLAWAVSGGRTAPIALSQRAAPFGAEFKRLHGAALESMNGLGVFGPASAGKGGAVALVEPTCVAEGPRDGLRALLSQVASVDSTWAGADHATAQRLFAAKEPAAVALVYVPPGDGADLFAVVQDLDRMLGSDVARSLQEYQKTIQVLGPTRGARLDLSQDGSDLAASVLLVMANGMSAQLAGMSLEAGRGMIRAAARNAVKSGSLAAADGAIVEAALETMRTATDGETLHVRLRIPAEAPSPDAR